MVDKIDTTVRIFHSHTRKPLRSVAVGIGKAGEGNQPEARCNLRPWLVGGCAERVGVLGHVGCFAVIATEGGGNCHEVPTSDERSRVSVGNPRWPLCGRVPQKKTSP